MRRFGLGLSLVSLAAVIGCTPPAPAPAPPPKPAGTPAPTSGTTGKAAIAPAASTKLVSFHVEGMTCPVFCYPKVKEALEAQAGVESVELAKQKLEGSIDNPQVFVKLNGNFDTLAAIAAIKEAGFEGSVLR